MKRWLLLVALTMSMVNALAVDFDFGGDLRIREEVFDNLPGLPGGGFVRLPRGELTDHFRFRVRPWAEVRWQDSGDSKWRIYGRLADEIRYNERPRKTAYRWPDELIVDNLFIEGKDLLDGWLDVSFGRQDRPGYCNLNHVFIDGTPGDGSRTMYFDMATMAIKFDQANSLNLFAMHNLDDNEALRWGTRRSRHRSLTARFPGGAEANEWAGGAIWCGRFNALDYRLFAMTKKVEHDERTDLVGIKLMQTLNPEWRVTAEAMSELNHETSLFAGIDWRYAGSGIKPFAGFSAHAMSGEWDPMWMRYPYDSELFAYGTHNGVGWWSNTIDIKLTGGLEFAPKHSLAFASSALYAADDDGLGGGEGHYKGLLASVQYAFPLITPKRDLGECLAIDGHLYAEWFEPGDYYESDQGAWFFRWQLTLAF